MNAYEAPHDIDSLRHRLKTRAFDESSAPAGVLHSQEAPSCGTASWWVTCYPAFVWGRDSVFEITRHMVTYGAYTGRLIDECGVDAAGDLRYALEDQPSAFAFRVSISRWAWRRPLRNRSRARLSGRRTGY